MTTYFGNSMTAPSLGYTAGQMAAAITFWTKTIGLPYQITKIYFDNTGAYPTSFDAAGSSPAGQQAIANAGCAMILCYKPTYPVPMTGTVPTEMAALKASVNFFLNAGVNVPAIVFYQEVDNGNQITPAEYQDLCTKFQGIRSIVPLHAGFNAWKDDTTSGYPAYFGNGKLFDGIGVDAYDALTNQNKDITPADTCARNALPSPVPLSLFEFGSNPDTGTGSQANFKNLLSSFETIFGKRATDNQPAPMALAWYNQGPSGALPAANTIDAADDPRIPLVTAFFATFTGTSATGPYDIGSNSTSSSGTTLTVSAGTGSVGSPEGSSAGDLVTVVITSTVGGSPSITGVTDSQGNSYAQVNSYAGGSSQNQWVWASLTTHALVSGTDTITITWNAAATNRSAIVRGCPGVASATADVAVVANGTSTAPTVTSGTLGAVDEYVIGAIVNGNASTAPTGLSFGTAETVKSSNYLTVIDELVTANTAPTASGTLTSSAVWSATVTSFKLTEASPKVVTTSLSAGVVGTAYSAAVTAKNGTKPYSFSKFSGSLPAGLSLATDGTITGTPTTTGTSTFVAEVTDANSLTANSGSLSITVTSAGVGVTTGSLANGTVGAAYSATETAGGGTSPYTWALYSGSLPPGISLSSAGAFTGTPLTAGVYSFVVQVTDNTGATALSSSQSITVNAPNAVTTAIAAVVIGDPVAGTTAHDQAVIAHGSSTAPSVTSGTLAQAEEDCIAFFANTNTGGTPTLGGSFSSLKTQSDGSSHVTLTAASKQVTATTSVTASATITSAPWTAAILTDAAIPLSSSFVVSDGVQGAAFSQTLEASGGIGTLTWALASGTLPTGLTLSAGVISGTPTVPGTYAFVLSVTDAHSVSLDLPQTVTILASGASVATLQPIAGDILTAADCDFEAGSPTWAATTNASSVGAVTDTALTGSHSMRWTATADGSTTITTGKYNVTAGKSYIVSGYLLATSNQAPNLWIGVNWYTSGNTFLSSSSNGGVPLLTPLAWQGVQGSFVAPATAAKASVFVIVDEANAGDMNYLDTVFLGQSSVQILVDWVNPAFGPTSMAGGSFMDVSPWLRLDQAINIQRGRQDAISEISTGQAYFVLQNDSGWFTQNNQNSFIAAIGGEVTLGARCQVNLADENGAWHTRFDGPTSQIINALDPTGNTNIATLYASDVFAPLSRQASPAYPGAHNYFAGPLSSLECWTKEQVIANGPQYHWSLDDQPNPSGELYLIASETSGNNGPPLKLVRSAQSAGSSIAWNDTTGGVETLADTFAPGEPDGSEYWPNGSNVPSGALRGLDAGTVGPFTTPMPSVYFTPALNAASQANAFTSNTGYMLQALLPTPLAPSSTPGGDFAVEAWFTMDPSIVANVAKNYGPYTVFSLGSSRRGGDTLVAGVFQPTSGNIPAGGAALYGAPPAFGTLNFTSATPMAPNVTGFNTTAFPDADTVQRPHHLVVSVQGDPAEPQATVYIDGNVVANITFAPGVTFDTITVGGAFGKTGCFYGNISMVSIYPFQLTPEQVTLDCQLGQYGMWEAPTDDCIAQLVEYADLPPFWNAISAQHRGLSLTDYYDITGNSPYNAMTTFEQTENGLLFVNAAGQLSFHTRDWRMGYGAPKLALPPDSYSEQLNPSVLDSYQTNENAVASAAFPGGATYVNQASQDQYGTYATNPVGSPIQLAHISYSRGYGAAGLQESTFWPDPNMEDAAAWQANSFAAPWYVLGGVTVDALTVDPTWGVNISNFYSVDIDDLISLAGTLPSSLPNESHANEYFIEGVSEVYQIGGGGSQRTITYYVSPAEMQRGWIPGDAAYGVLSQTTRLGISQADLSVPQADGKDVSHDGGPPYWAPTFSSTMNSPGNGTGFVGMNDMRGLTWPLQQILQPPMVVAKALNNTQSIATGLQSNPQVLFDTLIADPANGMGALPGWPNWYVCLVPGFYEIDAEVHYAGGSSGGSGIQGWIVVALDAAQQVVAGTGYPVTAGAYVCPIGETVRQNSVSMNAVAAPTTRLYLGLGDMVTLATEHDYTSSLNTSVTDGGSGMSVRFVGLGTVDDRAQVNSSINGGTVINPTPPTHGTKTYTNQHTYAHYGPGASNGQWQLTPNGYDTDCYVGFWNSTYDRVGMQFSLIRFPWGQMQIDLAGKTLTSVTLTGTNQKTTYATNALLPGGYYYTNGEAGTWESAAQSTPANRGLWGEWFNTGKTQTFALPAAQFQQYFVRDVAHGIILGTDAKTEKVGARYLGGPNSWTLTVSY